MPWIRGGCVTDLGRQIGPQQAIVAFRHSAFDFSSHPDWVENPPAALPRLGGRSGASLVSYRGRARKGAGRARGIKCILYASI